MLKRTAFILCLFVHLSGAALEVIVEAPFLGTRAQGKLCLASSHAPLFSSACTEYKSLSEGKVAFNFSEEKLLSAALDASSGALQPRSLFAKVKDGWLSYTCVYKTENLGWPPNGLAYWPEESLSLQRVARIYLSLKEALHDSNCEMHFETTDSATLGLLDITRTEEVCGRAPPQIEKGSPVKLYQGYQPPDKALVAGMFKEDGQFSFEAIWVDGTKQSTAKFCRNFASDPTVFAGTLKMAEQEIEARVANADSLLRWVAVGGAAVLSLSVYQAFRRDHSVLACLAAVQSIFYWRTLFDSLQSVDEGRQDEVSGAEKLRQSQEKYHALRRSEFESISKRVLSLVGVLPWALFLDWQLATGRVFAPRVID